jgi:hypothetical protein
VHRLLALFISFHARLLSDDTVHTTLTIWYDNFRSHFSGNNPGSLIQNPNQSLGEKEGAIPNYLLFILIVSEVLTGLLLTYPKRKMPNKRQEKKSLSYTARR